MNAIPFNLQFLTQFIKHGLVSASGIVSSRQTRHAAANDGEKPPLRTSLASLCFEPLPGLGPVSESDLKFAPGGRHPHCLASLVLRMLSDGGWSVEAEAMLPAQLVMDFAFRNRSATDAATVLEPTRILDANWPHLVEEVECYLDFCRVREIEAGLRGVAANDLAFDREAWSQARQAEECLRQRARSGLLQSFQPKATGSGFRVF